MNFRLLFICFLPVNRMQSQSELTTPTNSSHPYRMPHMLQEKLGDDFPLRKTGEYKNQLSNNFFLLFYFYFV